MIYNLKKRSKHHNLPHGKENKHLEDSIKNRVGYFKRVENMMDAHESMQKSITFRKNLLDKRAQANYQNEYEKLRGILAHTVVPQQTTNTVKTRLANLEKLGIQALPTQTTA